MIDKKFFLFNYEKETIKSIINIIKDAYSFKYCYEELIIIFNNYNNETKEYDFNKIIQKIINRKEFEKEKEKLKKLKEDFNETKKKIVLLENIQFFYENYKSKSKNNEIEELKYKIKGLMKGNLKLKNGAEYEKFINRMYICNITINQDINLIKLSYFKNIYNSIKNKAENKEDEDGLFNQAKEEIEELKKIMFDKDKKIQDKMLDENMKKS